MPSDDYPNLWKRGLIQQQCYKRAGYRCEHCGMKFVSGSTLAESVLRRDGRPMVLTIHHINNIKQDCSMRNLVALCQRCHMYVQYRWQPGAILPWVEVPVWITSRNLPYIPRPQLRLL